MPDSRYCIGSQLLSTRVGVITDGYNLYYVHIIRYISLGACTANYIIKNGLTPNWQITLHTTAARPGAIPTPTIPTPIPESESESESFVVRFGGVGIGVGIVVIGIGIGVGIVVIGIGVGIGIR